VYIRASGPAPQRLLGPDAKVDKEAPINRPERFRQVLGDEALYSLHSKFLNDPRFAPLA